MEFHGSTNRFFSIIEQCATKRPVSIIVNSNPSNNAANSSCFNLFGDVSQCVQVLCLFFAFGCFVDTVYSCIGLYYPILTIARVKDFWGMFGMWVFTFVLAFAPKVKDPDRWPIFFWFAAAVDFISICSVFVPWNIYKKPVVLKTT